MAIPGYLMRPNQLAMPRPRRLLRGLRHRLVTTTYVGALAVKGARTPASPQS